MWWIKNIIRKQYSQLREVKKVVSKGDLNDYLGFSVDTYQKKLKKIDSEVDCGSYKISTDDIIFSLSEGSIGFPSKDVELDPNIYEELSENDLKHYLELKERFGSVDGVLVLSLQEQYGDQWYHLYSSIIDIRQSFRILINFEERFLNQQNNQFQESTSKLFQYEYFDLIFTVK